MSGTNGGGFYITLSSYIILGTIFLLIIGSGFGLPLAVSIAVGGSMYPTIHSGDLTFLVSTKLSKLNVGDIGVYKAGSVLILHRVIDISGNTVIFEGDNNVYKDSPVPASDVIYKLVFTIPYIVWVPVLSVLVITLGLLPQYYIYRKKGEVTYTYHTYMIFLMFMILISIFSASVFVDKGYNVKPNPMPSIEKIKSVGNGKYIVMFNTIPKSVQCTGGYCITSGRNVIVKPTGDTVWLHMKLPTPYNLTVEFTLNFGG